MTPYTKNILRCIASALTIEPAGADTVAYWDQNSNALPGGSSFCIVPETAAADGFRTSFI